MVELPDIVIKTRSLLTLRGFKVSELLEYENRYMMLPEREHRGDVIKKVVWIYKIPKVVGVALVRDLVREMGGRRSQQAKGEIVKHGAGILKILLDELAAALDRIENAPRGISAGVLGPALGPVKKVNPRDEAIVKRIPKVVGEIAKKTGTEKVRRRIKKYPNAEVRKRCASVLDKLKR